jgi:hypothetical protein
VNQDSVYDHSKPRQIVGTRNPEEEKTGIRYDYQGPFGSTQERLISQALNSMTMPGPILQELVRPNLPQIQLLPPRFGYRTRQLNLTDVLNVDEEFYPTRVDFSQTPGGYSGTQRNAQGQGFW